MPGIKPDLWIRRMAKEHGMIKPFEPGNVRHGFDPTTTMTQEVDREVINDLMEKAGKPPLEPTGPRIISYGTSSYGYDMRVATDFKVFTPTHSAVVDPKEVNDRVFDDVSADVMRRGYCLIPPNSFALCRSVEYFRIPRDVLCIVLGKSSYARCGIVVNVTPLEPDWEGHVTIEISNTTPLPAKVYANEGIAQVLFLQTDEVCGTSYGDKGGKYMKQGAEIVLPRM